MKRVPLACVDCGRFVGKDGDPDIIWDDWNGAWEIGYPRCGACLRGAPDTEGQR